MNLNILLRGQSNSIILGQLAGADAVGSTAEEFSTFQQSEITRTAELVRISGATVE